MLKVIFTLGLVSVFAGCASNVKNACETRDWREYGVEQGRKGVAEDHVLAKEKQCAKAKIEIPIAEYKEGWLVGINEYCGTDNAFDLGKKKAKHSATSCPVELRPAFDEAYAKGLKLADINKEISGVENQIEATKKEKSNVKERMSKIEGKLDNLDEKESKLQSKKESLIKSRENN